MVAFCDKKNPMIYSLFSSINSVCPAKALSATGY